MSKLLPRPVLSAILLGLLALPALAQPVVRAGKDPWVTPPNGQTFTIFAKGDVEALCGLPPDAGWNHTVLLQGIPAAGSDYDTVVARLDDALFDASGVATTRIQVIALAFRSMAPTQTPCGALDWTAGLSGPQAVTKMTIVRNTPGGGVFSADLVVNVELRAFDAGTSNYRGSVFYAITLPQPTSGGTPWSFGPDGQFRAGMTETNDCIAVLRQKLTQYATTSDHYYYISDMIAQGRCTERQ